MLSLSTLITLIREVNGLYNYGMPFIGFPNNVVDNSSNRFGALC